MLQLKFGMSPISWTNDDLPQLGGDTTLETCLIETRAAGYSGTETGGKFPKTADALAKVLKDHDLDLVSGWYSGQMMANNLEDEIKLIQPQLDLFKKVGASVIVYGETYNTVQNKIKSPLATRPKMAREDFPAYAKRMTGLAEYCEDYGVPLSYHHHMGTALETEDEIDLLMKHTGSAFNLLLDTGHLVFAGGNITRVLKNHGKRINHFHAKDIRQAILKTVDRSKQSFLDCVLEGVFTVPGDGMINYQEAMNILHDQGYQGWVIVEAEQDPIKANPFIYAKMGFDTLKEAALNAGFEVIK